MANRGVAKRAFLLGLALTGTLFFAALGIWQVERRTWKLALIEAVDERVQAPPSAVPARTKWPSITARGDEYRHVTAQGRWLGERETLVEAVTEIGNGFWVITPLRLPNGDILLVNRGYVPPDRADPRTRKAATAYGDVRVTGLLRITEPGGRLLRPNRPQDNRWYSRDVAAIANARRLTNVAPFFVDADSSPNPGGWPRGGLTVTTFPNNHLLYALTWFGLAMLSAYACVLAMRNQP